MSFRVISFVLFFSYSVLAKPFRFSARSLPSVSNELGQLDSPRYPFYLPGPIPAWSSNETSQFNPDQVPDTGVTRTYNFAIARGLASPDGYQIDALAINGQIPGPTIEANWGDWVEVTVQNNIVGSEEGTSIHWHGLLQRETPWYDGVPSVSQCPIAPNATFVYKFRADSFGTSWYHSHYSAQYAAGLSGPIIFHGPSQLNYDIDLGPVMLSDWYHKTYNELIDGVESLNQSLWVPVSQGNLINGHGHYDCSLVQDGTPCSTVAGAKFRFTAGKTHRLRLLNTGAEAFQFFTIDGHILTVITNDLVPIEPYNTTVVKLGVGQRTDVLVYANGSTTDSFWMRGNISTPCSSNAVPNMQAAIYYDDADSTQDPDSQAWPFVDLGDCTNDALDLMIPYFPITPPATPAVTQTLSIVGAINASGYQEWQVNGQSFHANYNDPILLLASEKNYSYPGDPEWNVYNFGTNSSVRLIIQNDSANATNIAHPMHLHGHDFWLLAEGVGRWDGSSIVNPQNPPRRDTLMLQRHGYSVIEFVADNPGVWSFHCHIAWHVSEGLYVNIMEQPQNITSMEIPDVMQQTCNDWDEWSTNHIVDQIDSGLKERS